MYRILLTILLAFIETTTYAKVTFKIYESVKALPENVNYSKLHKFQLNYFLERNPKEKEKEIKYFVKARLNEQMNLLKKEKIKLVLMTDDTGAWKGISWLYQPENDCLEVRQTNALEHELYSELCANIFITHPEVDYLRMKVPDDQQEFWENVLPDQLVKTDPYDNKPSNINWVYYRINRPE